MSEIKEFLINTYHPRRTRHCVIIGVLNEGQRFLKQFRELTSLSCKVDIIIADGGSSDGATTSPETASQAQALIVDQRRMGLSGQYQLALKYAIDQGYEGMIMMDGNGKDGMEAVPEYVSRLNDGFDLIQGSRFLPQGSFRNTPWIRYFAIRMIFSPLMSLTSGFYYTDAINGFKGVSRKLLDHPDFLPFRESLSHGYRLQYFINYRTPQLGLQVLEIPVRRDYPSSGKVLSKIKSLSSYSKILWDMTCVCCGFYNK